MKYRTEIDGLRAVAVIPVIFFHAGIELFSGGFVGVDVFFVISGYLITSILIEEIENQRFSIINFYERRARRILPALYFMLLVVSCISAIIMMPEQLKDYGQSLVSTVSFTSNIYFFLKTDYWAQSSEFFPLLHTWSLGVEEQYYIFFPIFLFVAWRFGKNKVFWVILFFAISSLLLSEWGWRNSSAANFFLTPSRVWELFTGSIGAILLTKQVTKKNELLSLIGLAAIIISIFWYDKSTPFPSVYSLVPVIGSLLLIVFADKDTIAGKILSSKALVGIGLISYPAYLWHQPILALTRVYQSNIELSSFTIALAVFLTFTMAFFSFRNIEKPFRRKNNISRKAMLYFSVIPFVAFSIIGVFLHLSHGLKDLKFSQLSPQTQLIMNKLEEQRKIRFPFWGKLLKHAKDDFHDDSKIRLLFLGDSLSEDLYVASSQSKRISRLVDFRRLAFDDECAKHIATNGNEFNYNGVLCSVSIDEYLQSNLLKKSQVIVIAAAWLSNAEYLENLLTHKMLKNKKIIVYKSLQFTDISSLIYKTDGKYVSFSDPEFMHFLYLNKHSRGSIANAKLQKISQNHKVATLNGYDAFCNTNEEQCSLFSVDGVPYIIDQAHLSMEGVSVFEKWFTDNLLKEIKK